MSNVVSGTSSEQLFSLTGKVALITGGVGGLGKRMALALGAAGADLILVDRPGPGLDAAATELRRLGRRCLPIDADVTRLEDVQRMIRAGIDHFGRLNIAVNSAGINIRKPALEYTEADWDAIVDVNLKGLFFCCLEEGRVMVAQRGGRIINISSVTSEAGLPRRAIYAATKGGVTALTRVLASEWAASGVTVNCLGPGHMLTPLTAKMFADPEVATTMIGRIPAGRLGEPADLDGAIVYLASDASAYMTGQTLYVDGGFLLNTVAR